MMSDIPVTEPVAPVMVAHVDRLARKRNRVLIALAAFALAVVVAVVAAFGYFVYQAAADSHHVLDKMVRLQNQAVQLQSQNHDLLEQVQSDAKIIQRDDALIVAATSPDAQAAQGKATQAAVDHIIVCQDNFIAALAGRATLDRSCPVAAVPPPRTAAPTTTTTTAPRRVASPAASPPTTRRTVPTTTTTLCGVQLAGVCIG